MLWAMAWRNLWRNRRRTLLTVAAIGLGLAVLVTMSSFTEGMKVMMVEQIAQSSLGHIQLHHPDYLERKTTGLVMSSASRLLELVRDVQGVKGASSRLIFSGSIRSSLSSTVRVVRVLAVDPAQEQAFSALDDKVVEGGFVSAPPGTSDPDAPARMRARKGIMVGRKLADQLKVTLGSKVRVDTAGFDGAAVAMAFYVTGILETGTDAFDQGFGMVNLKDMQEATSAGDTVHEISVMVGDPSRVAEIARSISHAISQADGATAMGPTSVAPWWEVLPDLKQMLDMSDAWMGVLYMLMLIILSAGILTTMFMVVFERKREFGVQLALGTGPSRLFAGLVLESFLIATLASVVGLLVGAVNVAYIVAYGLDLSWFMEGFEFAGMFVENVYKGAANVKVFAEPTVVVFAGTVLMALWPAVRVARMSAIDAMR